MAKIKTVSYEELRNRYFTKKVEEHKKRLSDLQESYKGFFKEEKIAEEGRTIQFYEDALNAIDMYWHKIEYDEEGKLVNFPSEGECALFCRKDGGIFLDEVCADDIEDGVWPVYLDGGIAIDDLVAWMPIPKPYKETE